MPELQIQPIPTSERLFEEFIRMDASMNQTGGISFEVARRALSVSMIEEVAEQEKRLTAHGMYLVDMNADPDDPETYKACNAYVDGYRITEAVLSNIYEGPYTFDDWFSVAESWRQFILKQKPETIIPERFRDQSVSPMIELGIRGVRMAGGEVFAIVRKWSEDLHSDESLHNSFMLGSGVMISSAALRQVAINQDVATRIVSSSDFDLELTKLLGR